MNWNRIAKNSELFLVIGLMGSLLVMLVPIPPFAMDLLFAASISLSVAILLVSIYAEKPLDFSVFPTILLFSTLFRLSLNVASTRLVLLNGHEGTASAGHIIETFGNMVVGGSYVVGVVIFILLIIINFIVITKGSGRVAEVAARFILDAMPGKQMSIDADLNAGLINEVQARERRKQIEAEADFYGAMDGASKFVRGDAIAGVLITLINIVGGFAIGVLQRGLSLERAAELYTLMTIGDGIVTQIPSIIVSTAAGIVVTRAASGENLSQEVARQIFFQPQAMFFTAGILGVLALIPGVPALPFLALAGIVAGVAYAGKQKIGQEAAKTAEEERKKAEQAANDTSAPPEVDTLELQVGYGLVGLVEGETRGDLVERVGMIRKEFATELGIIVPKVRIKDNLELQSAEYAILVKGVSVGRGELIPGHLLAMDPGGVDTKLPGIPAKEPVFGLQALWIPEADREKAQLAGYTVVDLSTIIATHLSEVVRKHAHELIGRQELQHLVSNLEKTHPKVVEELIPKILPLGDVLRVCQNLLREGLPIRDLLTILETLANYGTKYKDPDVLTEFVRVALARTLTHRLLSGNEELEVLTLEPRTEEVLIRGYQKTDTGGIINLEPKIFESLVTEIQKTLDRTAFNTGNAVLLCHPMIRSTLRKLLERFVPNLFILSANEIATFAKVKSVGAIGV